MADKGIRLPAEIQAEIVALYRGGWSAAQIAKDMEVSVATVYNTLKRLQEPRRTHAEWVAFRNKRDRAVVDDMLAQLEN